MTEGPAKGRPTGRRDPGPDRPTTEAADGRRGRPHATSRREIELHALELFERDGFEETTVDQVASAAGVSRRTFFRYFESKSALLWSDFDLEVAALRARLRATPADVTVMDAIREAVTAVNHYLPEDIPELRARMNLIGTVPALQASAALHYGAWEEAIAEFVADRLGVSPVSLYPLAIGRATLAVCRAAYDRWVIRGDADLHIYLDLAIRALSSGFDPRLLGDEPRPSKRPANPSGSSP